MRVVVEAEAAPVDRVPEGHCEGGKVALSGGIEKGREPESGRAMRAFTIFVIESIAGGAPEQATPRRVEGLFKSLADPCCRGQASCGAGAGRGRADCGTARTLLARPTFACVTQCAWQVPARIPAPGASGACRRTEGHPMVRARVGGSGRRGNR